MKKLLFIGNVGYRFNSFALSSSIAAHELEIEFHIAGNWSGYDDPADRLADEKKYGIKIHQIDFIRMPYDPRNIKAYKQIIKLIREEHIDYIHCNTPIGGVVGRLAGAKCGIKSVIYQAHGFHFYKGAPKLNWLLYYPIERWLAHYTDALITINKEDYELARRKFKLRNNGKVYYVPGVGIDTSLYNVTEKHRLAKRIELGLRDDDIVVISAGDLIERKNYGTALQAIADTKNPKLQYLICGSGPELDSLMAYAKVLDISSQIHFLGFRTDIKELLLSSDIFLFTTKQEGLPRSMMEAMASGLPCIASCVRGNIDLIENTNGGFLCNTTDAAGYAEKLNILANNPNLRKEMGKNNLVTIFNFNTETVASKLQRIFDTEFVCGGG